MTRENLNPQVLLQFYNQHQSRLRLVVVVLLSLYLIAFAAELTWRIIPQPNVTGTLTNVASQPVRVSSSQNGVDITQIQRLHLFGNPEAAPKVDTPVITDAPETHLNLTLTGVVSSNDKAQGTAIIENRGKQAVYGLGEKIEGTNAILDQVQADRVIIRNGGRHETLMLDGLDYDEANRQRVARKVTSPRRAPPEETQEERRELSEAAVEATEQLRRQPANFTDYIAVSPATEGGQLIGYQVKPGKDPALFKAAGLQNGDVVIQINGLDLTDMQQAGEAMSELRSAQSIELTITRDGEYQTLYLDMPEPEAN